MCSGLCIKRHILKCETICFKDDCGSLALWLLKPGSVATKTRNPTCGKLQRTPLNRKQISDCILFPYRKIALWLCNQGQTQYDEYLSSRYLFGTHIWRGPASTWRARWAGLSPLAPAWGGMRARTRNRWVRRYPDTWSTPCEDMLVNGHVTKHQEPYNKVTTLWLK